MALPSLFISTSSRDQPVVTWLNYLFADAAQKGASDIHFEDMSSDETRIRYRVNGVLATIGTVSKMHAIDGMNKIRARANLPLSDIRSPLDGRFSLDYHDEHIAIDVRASFVPILYGTSLVCRILDQRNTARTLNEIEMTDEVKRWIEILLREPHGLFLVTGPTGSGKTSTLYALLNALHTDQRKIVTIENPVEYRVPGLCQTNIEGELTFAQALRAELRQDPDIVLVGEIRDAETAQVAVQAAMTGHLVMSTLHANDAAATVTRMLELGVDPNTLGAALRGVLAQRLVRKLADPFDWVKPSETEAHWLTSHQIDETDSDYGSPIVGEGDGEGYNGRLAVMELIVVDRTMRNVMPLQDPRLIRAVAKNQPQYQTLAQCAASLARRGLTGITELFTVSSVSEHLQTLRTLSERLVELGKLTPYQLEICKELQLEASRGGHRLSLEDVLIANRYCSQEDIDEVQAL
jgi:general secretion pathway protein E